MINTISTSLSFARPRTGWFPNQPQKTIVSVHGNRHVYAIGVSIYSCMHINSFLLLTKATFHIYTCTQCFHDNIRTKHTKNIFFSMYIGNFPFIASLKEQKKVLYLRIPQVSSLLVVFQSTYPLSRVLIHACDIVSVWILLSGTHPCTANN